MPGPVPNRSDQRRRRNQDVPIDHAPAAAPFEREPASPEWHRVAQRWYDALAESGQAKFYEPSDWATAFYVAEAMSRNLEGGRFSAQLFAAVMAASTSLLATEGDRRRLRLELERAKPGAVAVSEAEGVAQLDAYRNRLTS
jgi:hypothetical protein